MATVIDMGNSASRRVMGVSAQDRMEAGMVLFLSSMMDNTRCVIARASHDWATYENRLFFLGGGEASCLRMK
jgi:hypothetical protein